MEIEAVYVVETPIRYHYPQCHVKNHHRKSLKSHNCDHRLWDTRWPGSTAANGTVGTWRPEGGKVVTGTTAAPVFAGEDFDVRNAFAGIKLLVYDV
jgi:hypothetical protein